MVTFRSTMGVELIQSNLSDQMVADAARVSTGKIGMPVEQGFINFLMKNRHGSPFEHGQVTYRIECPIFVAREFMRHRTFSFNEESGRYKQMSDNFYLPDFARPLQQVGKAGEYRFEEGTEEQRTTVDIYLRNLYYQTYFAYERMLEQGVAREVARTVLPVGIYTSFYATCNSRALMNFLSLRTKDTDSAYPSYPQHEIEEVAVQMEHIFHQLMPLTHFAFTKNGRVAP